MRCPSAEWSKSSETLIGQHLSVMDCSVLVPTWAGHLAADIFYRSAVDVARQLSVSLLTISHISHRASQSGVHVL